MITPNEQFIEKNYGQTVALLSKFKLEALQKLIENFSVEYACAPASTNKEYHCAFPGGLCYHNLCVLQYAGKFASAVGSDKFTKESLLKVAILHDIGKVGEEGNPYYIQTIESWKREKGWFYEINTELQRLKLPQRSLFLAQQFNVPLTTEEYTAILLADGQLDEANSFYKYKEPPLATIIHFATYWARLESKNKVVDWTP